MDITEGLSPVKCMSTSLAKGTSIEIITVCLWESPLGDGWVLLIREKGSTVRSEE